MRGRRAVVVIALAAVAACGGSPTGRASPSTTAPATAPATTPTVPTTPSTDPTTPPRVGWRLVGTIDGVDATGRTASVAVNPAQWEAVWLGAAYPGDRPVIDFGSSIVVV